MDSITERISQHREDIINNTIRLVNNSALMLNRILSDLTVKSDIVVLVETLAPIAEKVISAYDEFQTKMMTSFDTPEIEALSDKATELGSKIKNRIKFIAVKHPIISLDIKDSIEKLKDIFEKVTEPETVEAESTEV